MGVHSSLWNYASYLLVLMPVPPFSPLYLPFSDPDVPDLQQRVPGQRAAAGLRHAQLQALGGRAEVSPSCAEALPRHQGWIGDESFDTLWTGRQRDEPGA